MFERVRLTVMDLEAAPYVVSAGSAAGSAEDFERAVVVVTEAAAQVRVWSWLKRRQDRNME
jgi:hypothetical protein